MAATESPSPAKRNHCKYCQVVLSQDKAFAQGVNIKNANHLHDGRACPTQRFTGFRELVDLQEGGFFPKTQAVPLFQPNESNEAYAKRVETLHRNAGLTLNPKVEAYLQAAQSTSSVGQGGANANPLLTAFSIGLPFKSANAGQPGQQAGQGQPPGTQTAQPGPSGPPSGQHAAQASALLGMSGQPLSVATSTVHGVVASIAGYATNFVVAILTVLNAKAGVLYGPPCYQIVKPILCICRPHSLKAYELIQNIDGKRHLMSPGFCSKWWFVVVLTGAVLAYGLNVPCFLLASQFPAQRTASKFIEMSTSLSSMFLPNDANLVSAKKNIVQKMRDYLNPTADALDSSDGMSLDFLKLLNHEHHFDVNPAYGIVAQALILPFNASMISGVMVVGICFWGFFTFFINQRSLPKTALLLGFVAMIMNWGGFYMRHVMICSDNKEKPYYAWVSPEQQPTVYRETAKLVRAGHLPDRDVKDLAFSVELLELGEGDREIDEVECVANPQPQCTQRAGMCEQASVGKFAELRDRLYRFCTQPRTLDDDTPGEVPISESSDVAVTQDELCGLFVADPQFSDPTKCVFTWSEKEINRLNRVLPDGYCESTHPDDWSEQKACLEENHYMKKAKKDAKQRRLILRIGDKKKAKAWFKRMCQGQRETPAGHETDFIPAPKIRDGEHELFRGLYPRHDIIVESVKNNSQPDKRVCRGNKNRVAYSDVLRYGNSRRIDLTEDFWDNTFWLNFALWHLLWGVCRKLYGNVRENMKMYIGSMHANHCFTLVFATVSLTTFVLPFLQKVVAMQAPAK